MKKCSSCTTWKPNKAFSKRVISLDGLQTRCKTCTKSLACTVTAREKRVKAKYNITIEQAQAIWDTPCSICGYDKQPSHIDHNHKTGEVRGALCTRCNTGIGLLGDNPAILQNAITYLITKGHYGQGIN